MGEIIANETTNKRLISKIHKQLMQLNTRKTKIPVKKWAEDLKRYSYKEDIQMTSKHKKRCSMSLIFREMQNYNEQSLHIGQNGHQSTNNKCWRGCREKETLLHCWWECKLISHYGE